MVGGRAKLKSGGEERVSRSKNGQFEIDSDSGWWDSIKFRIRL